MTVAAPLSPAPAVRLDLPAVTASAPRARARFREFSEGLTLGEDERYGLELALGEAVANAVLHGCGADPDRTVRVTLCRTPRLVVITVADPGPGFDPAAVPEPPTPSPEELLALADGELPEFSTGGRGIQFMRLHCDGVAFAFSERGTVCRLTKRLPEEPEP